jgi:hypothetical protein
LTALAGGVDRTLESIANQRNFHVLIVACMPQLARPIRRHNGYAA